MSCAGCSSPCWRGGHTLLEGAPGLGKTLLVRTLSDVLHLRYRRIQFTPDFMPADIIGTNILIDSETGERRFVFQNGPIFGNLILADEINRASPKTQSALLEAMQERTISVGTTQYPLPAPFFVVATQNPIEMAGTYPLPEAQLDRFLFKLKMGSPTAAQLAQDGLSREETNLASYTDQLARPFEHEEALLFAQRDLARIDRKLTEHTGSSGPPAQPRINADLDEEAAA
jgi:MoxR-like ATPase